MAYPPVPAHRAADWKQACLDMANTANALFDQVEAGRIDPQFVELLNTVNERLRTLYNEVHATVILANARLTRR